MIDVIVVFVVINFLIWLDHPRWMAIGLHQMSIEEYDIKTIFFAKRFDRGVGQQIFVGIVLLETAKWQQQMIECNTG